MALFINSITKTIEIPSAYYKITNLSFLEDWSDENWKFYTAFVTVSSYTDETKEFYIEQNIYEIKWLTESWLTLSNLYDELKKLEQFNLSTNI